MNQIVLLKGPFKLVGSISGTLESDLSFRWSPSIAVEFEGLFSEAHPVLDDARWLFGGDERRRVAEFARLKACAKKDRRFSCPSEARVGCKRELCGGRPMHWRRPAPNAPNALTLRHTDED